jgi:hypothetical protein
MDIDDLGCEFNMLFEETEIEDEPDDFSGSIISDFIERHGPRLSLPELACQDTHGVSIPNGGGKSWILKSREWDYTAG